MFPLLVIVVCANNNLGSFSTFNPFDQTQQDAVLRVVDKPVRGDAGNRALSDSPGTRTIHTVPHAGDHKEAVKVIQIGLVC